MVSIYGGLRLSVCGRARSWCLCRPRTVGCPRLTVLAAGLRKHVKITFIVKAMDLFNDALNKHLPHTKASQLKCV